MALRDFLRHKKTATDFKDFTKLFCGICGICGGSLDLRLPLSSMGYHL